MVSGPIACITGASIHAARMELGVSISLRHCSYSSVLRALSARTRKRCHFETGLGSPYCSQLLFPKNPVVSAAGAPHMLGKNIGLKQDNVMFDDIALSGEWNAI